MKTFLLQSYSLKDEVGKKNPVFESVNLDQLRLLYVDMWTVQYTHYSCECSALFMPKVLFITNVHYYLHAYHAIYVHV